MHRNSTFGLRSADEIVEEIIRKSVVDSDDFRDAVEEVVLGVLNLKMGGKGKAKRIKDHRISESDKNTIAVRVTELLHLLLSEQVEKIVARSIQSQITSIVSALVNEKKRKVLKRIEKNYRLLKYEIDKLQQYQRKKPSK